MILKDGIGLATAFRTLTTFKVWGRESKSFVTSLYWFVVVGIVLGVLNYVIIILLSPYLSPLLISSLAVTFTVWATRAFHLDGVADMADGFGGGWTKERVLEIMRDSHIGAFGAISIALLLIVKVAAISSLIEKSNQFSIIIIFSISRFLLVFLAHISPYARKEGTAHHIVGEAKVRHVAVAFIQLLLLAFFFYRGELLKVLLLFGSGLITSLYILYRGKKRIGGITGDMLGTTLELSEAIMLTVASL
ncbi:MAG: adenosylcobinamide-GDP ribazoletransferase [Spirochaetia bacterium]|nr:adenosylcobinamide-GDP ribazoletransferase [Spirochaetia bacterium]